jgi:hypothetical protein
MPSAMSRAKSSAMTAIEPLASSAARISDNGTMILFNDHFQAMGWDFGEDGMKVAGDFGFGHVDGGHGFDYSLYERWLGFGSYPGVTGSTRIYRGWTPINADGSRFGGSGW